MLHRLYFIGTCLLAIILSGVFFVFAPMAQAATTVTDAYAQPTNLVATEASNHKFVFTTQTGAAAGETIILTFEDDFDTASITEDDVDIDDDGVDLTTAADCSGSEEASVAMASDTLTITICAGDGGDIAAASIVTIEIGTNAAASGTGSNQITNPNNNATYSVNISGTFGENGAIWIPILSDDDAGVSATVPSSGSGGVGSSGGGGSTSHSVTVVAPNGGEEIDAGNNYAITWSSSGGLGYVNLYYSVDGGGAYTSISAAETNDGFYTWTVPAVSTEQALVKIELTDLALIADTDISDAVFSILQDEEEVVDSDPVEETEPDTDTDPENETDTDPETEDAETEDPTPDSETDGETDDGEEAEEVITTPEVIEDKEPKSSVPSEASDPVTETDDTVEEIVEEPEESSKDRGVTTEFLTPDRSIDLEPEGRTVEAFAETQTRIEVYLDDADEIDSARIVLGDETYPLTQLSDGTFTAIIPVGLVEEPLTVIADYRDGETVTDTYRLDPQPYGFVFERENDGEIPVPGASALVYRVIGGDFVQWDAGVYGQRNPVIVGDNGVIGWYVPNGEYVVVVQKEGYEDARVEVMVSNHLLAPRIELRLEQVCDSAWSCLREDARVELGAKIAKAVAILTLIGGTTILASSFSLWNFLRFFFTQPFLFFARRKRKQFGIVYNAATKAPIDLAIVRLYNEAGKLVRTMVTDDEGRYFFKVDPGRYTLKAIKDGFVFPSEMVLGRKEDGPYLDIYTKGFIEVTANDVIIAANIPMDPEDKWSHHSPKSILWRRFLRIFQHSLALSGVILSLLVTIFFPTALNIGLFILQVALYLLTLRIARPKKPTGWGIVRDAKTNKPLANTVIRLFEPKFNKLIETTVTDGQGKYAFMVGQNKYFVTYEKPGYQKAELKPVDYTKKAELTPIAVDMTLSKDV